MPLPPVLAHFFDNSSELPALEKMCCVQGIENRAQIRKARVRTRPCASEMARLVFTASRSGNHGLLDLRAMGRLQRFCCATQTLQPRLGTV